MGRVGVSLVFGQMREKIGAEHPLVVLSDDLSRLSELLGGRYRGGEGVDDAVVKADEGQGAVVENIIRAGQRRGG